ncbi:MAG: ABC transporter substrate-binding protein [Bacteriovoracaceae bacterium]
MKLKKMLRISLILAALFSGSAMAKTFVYCSEGSPSAFNPQVVADGTSINASAMTVYNRLVEFKVGSTQLEPALAESWSVSKDRRTYTFQLRKGVKFHKTKYFTPKRDFNADDVVFSINRMRVKDHRYHKVGGGTYEYFLGMGMNKLIKDVKKLNDYSVQIVLAAPEAPFLSNLAMPFMSILSEEYSQYLAKNKKNEDIDFFPIGTGPFVYKKYIKDNLIRFTRNKNYWKAPAKVKNLVFAITPDASVRFQKLKAKECHLITHPAPTDLDAMKSNKKIKVVGEPGLNVGYLAMNVKKKPLDNAMVRKAIYHALNKEAYIKAIYLGNAMEAVNPLPPSIWSYLKNPKAPAYDPAKSKALLKKAGLSKGIELELWTLPVSRPYNPNGKKMGEMMKADLEKVGIKAKLVQYDWPTYLKKSQNGEHDLLQIGWTGDNGDPDNFLHTLLGCDAVIDGSNYAKWCHKKYDELVIEAKRTDKQKQRAKLYEKAQKIFQKELPWVPLAHAKVFRAMADNVKGYKIHPFGSDIFYDVDLK